VEEPVAACLPTGGAAPQIIDTNCTEEARTCFAIRTLPGELLSEADDFGVSIAVDVAMKGSEWFCFTSTRSVSGGENVPNNASQNLWISHRQADGFDQVHPLTSNMTRVFEGAPSFAPDGRRIFFAAKNRPDTLGDCDLYSATLHKTGIRIDLDHIERLPVINSKYFDSHPSISPDGQTMYFASDRPGGLGNTDIWYSIRISDVVWSEAMNLGPMVNTSCDEVTPFICADNKTLYFSSNGRNTVGGFDIFTATKNEAGNWSTPENVGTPINTEFDELFPATPPNARADSVLYFSSNRRGGKGGFDLYSITPNPRPPFLVTLQGTVVSKRTGEPVPNANLFWKDKTTSVFITTIESDAQGRFFLALTQGHEYEVGAQAENFFHDTYSIHAPKTPGVKEFNYDFRLTETLSLRINFPFNDFEHPLEYVLDENGDATTSTWQEEVQYLALNLTSYRERIERITLTGHTDSIGTSEYNTELSKKRAEFVRSVLMKKYNIPERMIAVIGKGEDELPPRRPGESEELFLARCRRVELSKTIRAEGDVK